MLWPIEVIFALLKSREVYLAAWPQHRAVSLRLTVERFSFLFHPEAQPQDGDPN